MDVFAMLEESWLLSVLIGLLGCLIGLWIASAEQSTSHWKPGQLKYTGIAVSISAIGLIVFAILDRFLLGWQPGLAP